MRVAVVGATGNAGTAVLRALSRCSAVTSVMGVARRRPDVSIRPYADCDWASIDIAAATKPHLAVERLTDAFEGAEAVIHLAWLIQPNSRRELLRRVNVDGTANVAEAAARAGVSRLVVASSVGAYSPVSPDRRGRLHDETHPTGGIPTSHYSMDKAAQERVLDDFEARGSGVVVSRLRPGLVFQPDAASEIQRYFLGGSLPLRALAFGLPPALPVPAGLHGVQAVHADDLAQAYLTAALRDSPGAFNICADDVLDPQRLADVLDHGRRLPVPTALVRGVMGAAHRAGLLPADTGWLDMALQVPLMDHGRARRELDWRPNHSAAETLTGLREAMIQGRGLASGPLTPRRTEQSAADSRRPGRLSARAAGRTGSDRGGPPRITDGSVRWRLVDVYLADHLTGATAVVRRIDRMAAAAVETPVYAGLAELAEQIRRERDTVDALIRDLGLRRHPIRRAAALAAEEVGRLKGNGMIVRRSPMTLLLETEILRSAVAGKIGLWQTLSDEAEGLGLAPAVFDDLTQSALEQSERLEEIHRCVRSHTFSTSRTGPSR